MLRANLYHFVQPYYLEGDKIEEGQVVATINCMKMDIDIISESSGVVKEIPVKGGDALKADDVIMTLN